MFAMACKVAVSSGSLTKQALGLSLLVAFLPCALSFSAFAGVQGCDAYSKSGELAQVTLNGGHIAVQLIPLELSPSAALSTRAALPVTNCSAFFSEDAALLAIGLYNEQNPKQHLQVAVVDVRTPRWLQASPMIVRLAPDSRGRVQGFVANTHQVLVLNSGMYFDKEAATTAFPSLVNVLDGTAATAIVAAGGSSITEMNSVIDPAENQIWLRDRRNACNLRSFDLDSSLHLGNRSKPAQPVTFGCSRSDLLIACPPNVLLEFSRDDDQTLIRRLQWDVNKTSVLRLSGHGKGGYYLPHGEWTVSPDGKVVAVEVIHFLYGRMGNLNVSRELLVVTTDPLAVESTVPLERDTHSFAIYHSDGVIKLSFLHGSHWEGLKADIGRTPISWTRDCEPTESR
jgi:hypothetical protein